MGFFQGKIHPLKKSPNFIYQNARVTLSIGPQFAQTTSDSPEKTARRTIGNKILPVDKFFWGNELRIAVTILAVATIS